MENMNVHIYFESNEGHTEDVVRRLKARMEDQGHSAVVARCGASMGTPLAPADRIIVAASVHLGKHQKAALGFARAHAETLNRIPSGFLSVSLSARSDDPEKVEEVAGYLAHFPERTGWTPRIAEAVAGALPYTRYGFFKRFLMKRIVSGQGGDTDTSRDFTYTDWDTVEAFADRILALEA